MLHAMNLAGTTGASLLVARLQDLVVNDYTRCKEREAGPCSLPVHWKVHSSCMRTGGGFSTSVSPVPHVVFSCARNCLSIALSTVGLLFDFTSLADVIYGYSKIGKLANTSMEVVFGLIWPVGIHVCPSYQISVFLRACIEYSTLNFYRWW